MANAGTYNHTKQHYAEGAAAATPDASEVVLYAKSDGLLYSKDDAGNETLVSSGVGAGDITTDAAWAAKGDLIVGTGNDTAAILTAGANDLILTADDGEDTGLKWAAAPAGGYASGTAFPVSPTSGDLFYRTNIDGGMLFRYDGTRWVSDQLFTAHAISETASDATTQFHAFDNRGLAVWVVDIVGTFFNGNNSGSNYWTVTVSGSYDGSYETIGAVNNQGDGAADWTRHATAVGAAFTAAHTQGLKSVSSKTGSPDVGYRYVSMNYRLIAT